MRTNSFEKFANTVLDGTFCTDAKKIEKQIGLARLEANKKLIMPGFDQTIAVSGTTDFGKVINNLINAGLSAGAVKEIVSKFISDVAGSSAGSVAGIIGGTAVLWWFSPIEAGESEEQATAWMAKGKNL